MYYKNALSLCALVAIFAWLFIFVTHHPQEFKLLESVSYFNLSLLLIAAFFYLFLQGVILNKALEAYHVRLNFLEWFGLLAVTLLGNYIVPFAGMGFRAKYLKDNHNLAYKEFSISLAAIFLIELFVFVLGGVIATSYLYIVGYQLSLFLVMSIFGSFVVLAFILVTHIRLPNVQLDFIHKINEVLACWQQMKEKKQVIRSLYYNTILLYLVSALMFYLAYHSFHLNVNFLAALLPTTLSDLSFILRITPGSLGTYDASVIYSSMVIGYTAAQGLVIVALIRLVTLFWIFVCGPICSFFFVSRYKQRKFFSNSEG